MAQVNVEYATAAPIQLPPAPRRSIEGIQLAAAAGGPLAIYAAEQLPRDASAATFDSALYFSQLRKRHGGTLVHVQDGVTALRPADLVWGGAMLYAEVITSTQTLLDWYVILGSHDSWPLAIWLAHCHAPQYCF